MKQCILKLFVSVAISDCECKFNTIQITNHLMDENKIQYKNITFENYHIKINPAHTRAQKVAFSFHCIEWIIHSSVCVWPAVYSITMEVMRPKLKYYFKIEVRLGGF